MYRKSMHDTSCFGVMSASSFHTGLRSDLAVEIPHRVDDRGEREVDDALLGPQPAQLRVAGKPSPEAAEVLGDLVQREAHDVITERFDRRRAHLVAAPDREREPVALETAVRLQNDVRRRVVRIGMHRIGAVLRAGRGEAEVVGFEGA